MTGYVLALVTALCESLKDLVTKFNLKVVDEYTAAFSMQFVQSILLLPFVLYTEEVTFSSRFLVALFSGCCIQLFVLILYFKALKISELSVSVPLLTLTPLFMLITSPIIVGEFPSIYGLIGIILVVIGTYVLNLNKNRDDFWRPFKSIITEKGPRYMLIVAFLWSLTANIDKIGVAETSPIFWSWSKDCLVMFCLVPIVFIKASNPLLKMRQRFFQLSLVGLFRTGSIVAQMFAIQFILVAYVISIKRTSAVFILIWAFLFLHERSHFKTKLLGISIILLGLLFILF